jgi:hypothetical protein
MGIFDWLKSSKSMIKELALSLNLNEGLFLVDAPAEDFGIKRSRCHFLEACGGIYKDHFVRIGTYYEKDKDYESTRIIVMPKERYEEHDRINGEAIIIRAKKPKNHKEWLDQEKAIAELCAPFLLLKGTKVSVSEEDLSDLPEDYPFEASLFTHAAIIEFDKHLKNAEKTLMYVDAAVELMKLTQKN